MHKRAYTPRRGSQDLVKPVDQTVDAVTKDETPHTTEEET